MKENTSFDLHDQFQRILPSILLQEPINHLSGHDSSTQQSSNQEEPTQVSLQSQKINIRHCPSTLMVQLQTIDVLILAFGFVKNKKSTVTLVLMRKNIGSFKEINLRALEVIISSMAFKLNRYNQIQLILGTACGRLLVYRNLQNFQAHVSCFRIQTHSIVSIQPTNLQNTIFALSESGTIFNVDISDQTIKYELKCLVPTVEDKQMKLLIDQKYKYICCCYSYGLIFAWDLAGKIISEINLMNLSVQNFEQQKVGKSKKMIKKQCKDIVRKNVSLKSKSISMSVSLQGIFWIDFYGQFLIMLTLAGTLKVVAVSFGQNGANKMLQTVISELKVCEPMNSNDKQTNKQKIIEVQKLNCNEIFISKSMQFKKRNLTCENVIQQYQLTQSYKIIKRRVINLETSSPIREIRFTHNLQFILCRSDRDFSISKLREAEQNCKYSRKNSDL